MKTSKMLDDQMTCSRLKTLFFVLSGCGRRWLRLEAKLATDKKNVMECRSKPSLWVGSGSVTTSAWIDHDEQEAHKRIDERRKGASN